MHMKVLLVRDIPLDDNSQSALVEAMFFTPKVTSKNVKLKLT